MNSNNRFAKEKVRIPGVHKWAAYSILRSTRDIEQYARYYSCWPNCGGADRRMGSPPIVMMIIIFLSVIIWLAGLITSMSRCPSGVCLSSIEDDETILENIKTARIQSRDFLTQFDRDRICDFGLMEFIWDPFQTSSFWRFFTYSFNSINVLQLIQNLLVYIFIGVPFEMVFGSGRTALLLICVSGLGSFASMVILPKSFIVGGSVLSEFFIFANMGSIMTQLTHLRSMEMSFMIMFLTSIISMLDYMHLMHLYYIRREPRWGYNKIALICPVPPIVGSVFGFLIGALVMSGYRRTELKQMFIEASIYVLALALMVILSILRLLEILPWANCELDYPSSRCRPLGCQFLGQNQEI